MPWTVHLIHSFIPSFVISVIHSFAHSFIYSWLSDSPIHSYTSWVPSVYQVLCRVRRMSKRIHSKSPIQSPHLCTLYGRQQAMALNGLSSLVLYNWPNHSLSLFWESILLKVNHMVPHCKSKLQSLTATHAFCHVELSQPCPPKPLHILQPPCLPESSFSSF